MLPGHGHPVLLHRFQQCRLRLGRGPVDLVGQQDVGEYGSLLEFELAAPLGRFEHDVRADQVGGHQVGGELDALELQPQRVRQGAHQQRLAQSGHSFEQDVAPGDQSRQRAVDDLIVADDDLGDLLPEDTEIAPELFELNANLISLIHRCCVLFLSSLEGTVRLGRSAVAK